MLSHSDISTHKNCIEIYLSTRLLEILSERVSFSQNKHEKFIFSLNAKVKVHVSCGEGKSKLYRPQVRRISRQMAPSLKSNLCRKGVMHNLRLQLEDTINLKLKYFSWICIPSLQFSSLYKLRCEELHSLCRPGASLTTSSDKNSGKSKDEWIEKLLHRALKHASSDRYLASRRLWRGLEGSQPCNYMEEKLCLQTLTKTASEGVYSLTILKKISFALSLLKNVLGKEAKKVERKGWVCISN